MPLVTPMKCWRGRSDCCSLASVEAPPPDADEEALMALEFEPVSFVCCGLIGEGARAIPQDAYRLCFKTATVDDMSDNDEMDLTHVLHVVSQTLAVISTRRVHTGAIDVLNDQGGFTVTETMQGSELPDEPTP